MLRFLVFIISCWGDFFYSLRQNANLPWILCIKASLFETDSLTASSQFFSFDKIAQWKNTKLNEEESDDTLMANLLQKKFLYKKAYFIGCTCWNEPGSL